MRYNGGTRPERGDLWQTCQLTLVVAGRRRPGEGRGSGRLARLMLAAISITAARRLIREQKALIIRDAR